MFIHSNQILRTVSVKVFTHSTDGEVFTIIKRETRITFPCM